MLWIEIIRNILRDIAFGMVFSVILAAIFYTSYRTVVKGEPFHKLVNVVNAANARVYNGRVDARMRHYREVAKEVGIISTMLPLLIVVIVAYLLCSQIIFFAVVGTGSMEPTLMTGDLVLIQDIHVIPQVGDILRFTTNSVPIPVVHRVVGVSEIGVKTKGDAGQADDWTVLGDQICGKVVVIGGNPIVIKSFGSYFIEDVSDGGMYTKYGREYGFVKKLVQSIKSFGLIIFFLCILMYILSVKWS